jgi:hypothetical protein
MEMTTELGQNGLKKFSLYLFHIPFFFMAFREEEKNLNFI